ncbi:MAG: peptidoglycan recognition family protein [Bacteroidota bacterium]
MRSVHFYIALTLFLLIFLIGWLRLSGRLVFIRNISDFLPRASSYPSRDLSQITHLIIHHSASENQDAYDYAQFHLAKGWPGIGYHFVIDPDGAVNQTNVLESVSYHTQNFNTPSVGICLSGDLNQHRMTTAQRNSLIRLIRHLKRKLPNRLTITGHRDHKATDCPGAFTDLPEIINRI